MSKEKEKEKEKEREKEKKSIEDELLSKVKPVESISE